MSDTFQILYHDEDEYELECLICGEVFVFDLLTGKNVDVWDGISPRCPSCGTVDKNF